MMVTAFISMWITNTATTAMMTPIMEAVLKQLDKYHSGEDTSREEVNEVVSKKISHEETKSVQFKAHESKKKIFLYLIFFGCYFYFSFYFSKTFLRFSTRYPQILLLTF